MRRLLLSILLVSLGCPFLAWAGNSSASPQDAVITINADHELGPVNRMIFGHNVEAGDSFGIFSKRHNSSNDGEGFWDPVTRRPVPTAMAFANAIGVGALRYPGGCLAHNFNWKQAVGPLSERPNFQFGIDEYISLCRQLRAEPVFTVSDYFGTAQEAAELVEYLNAPADARHPWAMKRMEWGHAEPYRVHWFELGNESEHGNHDVRPHRKFTPEAYSRWALDYMARMRAVDPSIKIGVVTVPGDGQNVDIEWNRVVFKTTVASADFVVLHFYTPVIPENLPTGRRRDAAAACLAVADQLGFRIRQYHQLIQKLGGRDLPVALTEYNVGAIQDDPLPYRFSFVAGMHAADFIRVCLEPRNNVVMANYWQILNGFWGMASTTSKPIGERAPYALYRLWGSHIGTTLLDTSVQTPRQSTPAFSGVAPAHGTSYQPASGTTPETFPAYPCLTVTASRSADGQSIYLVVFNKSLDQAVPTSIHLPANFLKAVQCVQVTDKPESITAAATVAVPAALDADGHTVRHTFPACSMTAFTFSTESSRQK